MNSRVPPHRTAERRTGIYAQRWTREEAIDYMLTNTGIAETDVISEIERYIVMPGHAVHCGTIGSCLNLDKSTT